MFCGNSDLLRVIGQGREMVQEVLGPGYRGEIAGNGWQGWWGRVLQWCWTHLMRGRKGTVKGGSTNGELYEARSERYGRLTKELETASPKMLE